MVSSQRDSSDQAQVLLALAEDYLEVLATSLATRLLPA